MGKGGQLLTRRPACGMTKVPAAGMTYVCKLVMYLLDYVLTVFVKGKTLVLHIHKKNIYSHATLIQNAQAHTKCTVTHGSKLERSEKSDGNFWTLPAFSRTAEIYCPLGELLK